jgi:hypothetical protein
MTGIEARRQHADVKDLPQKGLICLSMKGTHDPTQVNAKESMHQRSTYPVYYFGAMISCIYLARGLIPVERFYR